MAPFPDSMASSTSRLATTCFEGTLLLNAYTNTLVSRKILSFMHLFTSEFTSSVDVAEAAHQCAVGIVFHAISVCTIFVRFASRHSISTPCTGDKLRTN